MANEIPDLDIAVDCGTEKYEGLLKVLECIRPNWKKEDIKVEVCVVSVLVSKFNAGL